MKLWPFVLVGWLGLVGLPAVVQAQFTFTINNGAITLTGYTGPGGAVVIPKATNGYPVTGIATNGFFGATNITSLTIPGSIAEISYKAFTQCSGLTNVIIGNGTFSLGDFAFYYCESLVSATIPASVTNISSSAFRYCNALTTIALDRANPFYCIIDGVLFDKAQTTLVIHPMAVGTSSYVIPAGVKHIADYALASCYALTNVVIPDGVQTIGASAFYNDYQLKRIALPDSVVAIGNGAFQYIQLMTNLWLGNGLKSIGHGAFEQCVGLGSVTIPGSVTNMGNNVFWECWGLTNAVIGEGVTRLGNGLFYGCDSLTTVVIPTTVTDIGSNAFWFCSLTKVTLGNAVTNIGSYAFYYCPLTNVTLGKAVMSIGDYAFDDCTQLQTVTLPASLTTLGARAFGVCYDLTNVFFAGNAPAMNSSAFLGTHATLYYLPNTTGWYSPLASKPAVLWNPWIQTDSGLGGQTTPFAFTITGTANIPVVVEAGTNLGGPWISLQSVSLTNGAFYFNDSQSTKHPGRFYRLRSP